MSASIHCPPAQEESGVGSELVTDRSYRNVTSLTQIGSSPHRGRVLCIILCFWYRDRYRRVLRIILCFWYRDQYRQLCNTTILDEITTLIAPDMRHLRCELYKLNIYAALQGTPCCVCVKAHLDILCKYNLRISMYITYYCEYSCSHLHLLI